MEAYFLCWDCGEVVLKDNTDRHYRSMITGCGREECTPDYYLEVYINSFGNNIVELE